MLPLTTPSPCRDARTGIGFCPAGIAPPASPGYVVHGFLSVAPGELTRLPNGGPNCSWLRDSMLMRSWNIPYAARMVMRPSPLGSQASPTRGKNLLYLLQLKLFPQVYCGSPENTMPAGPFT